ncbi:MAG TPA: KUP/HAK/KT family potassium transporter, partial [Methylocystis sp.]|nr:KUP/HAK/KT family potassium transporter [Methylocystis sp.]
RWSLPVSLIVAGLFMTVDSAYVAANLVKFFEGGWIPLVVAAILFFLMSCWSEGYAAIRAALERATCPVADFIEKFRGEPRVEGTAVYLTPRHGLAPAPLVHNLKHNKSLHERVVLLFVSTEHIPRVGPERRVEMTELDDGFYAMTIYYGFMEQPDIPRALLLECYACVIQFHMMDTSFFSGRFTLVTKSASRWRRFKFGVFRVLYRNALSATEFFRIPPGRVVELGEQIEI